MGDIPTQVRIRTDENDGNGHRYETIQDAKGVFDVGNNTDAVLHACEHARQDVNAKQDALQYLARHVPADVLQETVARLSTRTLPLSVDTTASAALDDAQVDVRTGDVEK